MLYLGSEPPRAALSFTQTRALDYEAMERERRMLLMRIREAGADGTPLPSAAATAAATAAGGALLLRARVPSRLDAPAAVAGTVGAAMWRSERPRENDSSCRQLTVTLLLSNTSDVELTGLSLSVLVPAPASALQPQLQLVSVLPRTAGRGAPDQPRAVQLVLQVPTACDSGCGVPTSSTAQVVATYTAANSQLHCATLPVQLPMCLFCQAW